MSLRYGVPRREYEGLSREDLQAAAFNSKLSTEGTDEELIDRLVESHYPIYPLPQDIDPNSPRGVVFFAVLDLNTSSGVPRRGASVPRMIESLLDIGVPDEGTARQMMKQQIENLVRMYGYTVVNYDDETVTLAIR